MADLGHASIKLSEYFNLRCVNRKDISCMKSIRHDIRFLALKMKTCSNISATNWLTMRTAMAARSGRYYRGAMFGLGLFRTSIGKQTTVNPDRLAVSR